MQYHGVDNMVLVDGAELPLCLDKVNHSPTGFSWGYNGSGPAQLAYAILQNEYGDNHPVHYQEFKKYVICSLPDDFLFTSEDVHQWVAELQEFYPSQLYA